MIMQVDKKLELCNAQTLSNLIWSVATAKANLPPALLHRLDEAWAERALKLLDELWGRTEGWGQNVSNILWGYSQLRLDPMEGRCDAEYIITVPCNIGSPLFADRNVRKGFGS